MYAINRVFKSKFVSRKLKLREYKTVVLPIVMFVSEVWTLRATEVQLVQVWKRKILRSLEAKAWMVCGKGELTWSCSNCTGSRL